MQTWQSYSFSQCYLSHAVHVLFGLEHVASELHIRDLAVNNMLSGRTL